MSLADPAMPGSPSAAASPTPATRERRTGHAGAAPGQGPFLRVHLEIAEGRIRSVLVETYPCPGCQACGKAISELVCGKSLQEASTVRHADVVARVGPLPRHRQICFGLSVLALANALGQGTEAREKGSL